VVDSTPVECGRSRETANARSRPAGPNTATAPPHSRYFWGLRLHLLCTLTGLPVGFALTGAKADERQVLLGIFANDPGLLADRPGQILIGDKNYYGRDFEAALGQAGVRLLRPTRKGEPDRRRAPVQTPAANHRVDQRDGSRVNSTWNDTAGTPPPAYSSASCNASSR